MIVLLAHSVALGLTRVRTFDEQPRGFSVSGISSHPGPNRVVQHEAMTDRALTKQIANFERVMLQSDVERALRCCNSDYSLVLVLPTPSVPRERWLEVRPTTT